MKYYYKIGKIALIFLITVVFAVVVHATNYKNTLMAVTLDSGVNGAVTLHVKMKSRYDGDLSILKKAENDYVIILPEVDSNIGSVDLSKVRSSILSVNVKSMPYSNTGNGYTRINIRTAGNVTLFADSSIYDNKELVYDQSGIQNNNNGVRASYNDVNRTKTNYGEQKSESDVDFKYTRKKSKNTEESFGSNEQYATSVMPQNEENGSVAQNYNNKSESSDINDERTIPLLLVGVFVILIGATLFLINAKNKLHEIVGEKVEIEVDDEEKNAKVSSLQSIKNTINNIDSKYSKSSASSYKQNNKKPIKKQEQQNPEDSNKNTVIEKLDVIDLDAIFQQQTVSKLKQTVANAGKNEALEDFLSSAGYDISETPDIGIVTQGFDEDLYNRIMYKDSIKFSIEDWEKINSLLSSEIGDDCIEECKKESMSNPIKSEVPQKNGIESLLADYAIKQNIHFTDKDVLILNKLTNVELDSNFVSDLRVKTYNQSEFENYQEEEKINDNRFKELQNEISNFENNTESFFEDCVEKQAQRENSQEGVATLKVSDVLPDLSDALLHPEKYEKIVERVEADESSLLNSLQDVQFKPFSEGRKIEVINNKQEDNIPKKQDIKLSTEKKLLQKDNHIQPKVEPKQKAEQPKEANIKCVCEGKSYNIVDTAYFKDNKGCHLAKNNSGYSLLTFNGDNVTKIKEYETLKTEKIQIRLNETLPNGTERYLVKAGLNKLILDVSENKIEYVMDLC